MKIRCNQYGVSDSLIQICSKNHAMFSLQRLLFENQKQVCYKSTMHDNGEVAEWFKAAVLKTAEGNTSVSSNLTFSAIQ